MTNRRGLVGAEIGYGRLIQSWTRKSETRTGCLEANIGIDKPRNQRHKNSYDAYNRQLIYNAGDIAARLTTILRKSDKAISPFPDP